MKTIIQKSTLLFKTIPNLSTIGELAFLILFASLFSWSAPVEANNSCETKKTLQKKNCITSNNWDFALGIGAGIRTNPLNNSDNIPLVLLPKFSYYGKSFFIENLDFGYNLIDSNNSQLNIIATPSFDSVFFNRWDPSNIFVDIGANSGNQTPRATTLNDNVTEINPEEISRRKHSYLGGFEYFHNLKDNLLQFSLLTDISNVHSGSEVRFAFQYTVNQYFSTTTGFTWKNRRLNDYYYGVDEREIIDNRGAYQAQSSLNPFLRVSLNTGEGKDSWRMSLELQSLDSSVSQSPLLKDDKIITFFIGKYFHWHD